MSDTRSALGASPAPYGEWPSPITAEAVVAAAAGVSEIVVDGADIYWAESRPAEGGRIQLVHRRADGTTHDVLPDGVSARTRVHEYGGGAWTVAAGTVVFNSWDDQRLWVGTVGPAGIEDLRAITPDPEVRHQFRHADLELVDTAAGRWVLAVRERHDTGGEAANEIVAIALDTEQIVTLVAGADFVSNPRLAPDGATLAWVEWDHPNMPWDTTRVYTAPVTWSAAGPDRGPVTVVAGVSDVSSIMPEWSSDGRLHFVSDRAEWWNIVAVAADGTIESVTDVVGEVGTPPWVFAMNRYAFLADGRIAFAYAANGLDYLAVVGPDGVVTTADLPIHEIASVRVAGDRVVFVGAGFHREATVMAVAFTAEGAVLETLRPTRALPVSADWFAVGEPVSFPSGVSGERLAHALYYPPANPDVVAPSGPPPLLVLIHGGPTAMARARLDLAKAFWTSRGFALIDVNYGGSTGFGRSYRRLLDLAWGVVDVEDCLAAVAWAAATGRADPERLAIRGGSAGGFTVLAAMTGSDTFAAGASSYGVSDLSALAEETHKFESRYTDGLIGPYPEARAVYDERSPINHLDALTSPLIVFQGLEDEVVPPNQSERVVEALTANGVPVAYLAFEGEQHGFRRSETVIAVLEAELAFYGAVLGFTPAGNIPIPLIVNLPGADS